MLLLNKSLRVIAAVSFLTFCFYGCSSSSRKPAPAKKDLSKQEQKMLGTWKLVKTEGNDIYAGPPEGNYTWTFKANREATYVQKPKGMDANSIKVTWRLDKSNNIIFDNDTTYRVEKFGKNKMKWDNYKMAELGHSHIYIVEKR